MSPELPVPPFILITLYIWSLFAKGVALWRAAKAEQRNWFIALLVLNTIGIAEVIYLVKFAKKPLTVNEIKSWLPTNK